jgi:hypothetical protein
MKKELPLMEAFISNELESPLEINEMALVDKPAIELLFVKFSEDKPIRVEFDVNEDRRIISGVALLADTPIYRNIDGNEFNMFMSPKTIEDIVVKFFKKGYANNLNEMHATPLNGLTIFESFISDESRGIKPMKGFEDVPQGSWFISAKVDNDEVWAKVKDGTFKGFSIQGDMAVRQSKLTIEQALEKINFIVNDIFE